MGRPFFVCGSPGAGEEPDRRSEYLRIISCAGADHEGLETAVAALFGECIPSARLLLSRGRQPVLGILSIEDKAIVRFL